MRRLARFIRRIFGHRAEAARAAILREEINFIERLLDSVCPLDRRLAEQRDRLARSLDARGAR